jgi:hypothetical protein
MQSHQQDGRSAALLICNRETHAWNFYHDTILINVFHGFPQTLYKFPGC